MAAVDKELKEAIKALLRAEKVKLWDPPYSNPDGSGSVPQELIESYAAKCSSGE